MDRRKEEMRDKILGRQRQYVLVQDVCTRVEKCTKMQLNACFMQFYRKKDLLHQLFVVPLQRKMRNRGRMTSWASCSEAIPYWGGWLLESAQRIPYLL